MKKAILLLSGIAGATAGIILFKSRRPRQVTELAYDLQTAWADHHTVV